MFWFGFSPADPPPSEPAVIRIIEIAGRTKIPDKEGCSPLFSMYVLRCLLYTHSFKVCLPPGVHLVLTGSSILP